VGFTEEYWNHPSQSY